MTFRATKYSCYFGYITQAIVVNLTPIFFVIFQEEYHISFEMLGRLIMINFVVQIIADCLSVKYVDRLGYRTAAVAAHIFSAVGLVGLSVFPGLFPHPYWGLVCAVVLFAFGGGLLEVIISPIVHSLPGDKKATAMSFLHSFYSWGQVLVVLFTTVALQVFGRKIWHMIPLVWAIIPLFNLVMFVKVPLVPLTPEEERMPIRSLLSSRIFLIAMLLMMCSGAAELIMSQWSSLFAEKGLGVSKMVGDLLGPCLFAVLMGMGRVFFGVLGDRLPLKKSLLFCGALCIVCYGLATLSRQPFLALLGCAVCGFSVSLMWPGSLSLTAECYPKGGTAMFGILAIMGDLGASIGPWVSGLISDAVQQSGILYFGAVSPEQSGLKVGLLVGIVFPILLIIGVSKMKKSDIQRPAGEDQD